MPKRRPLLASMSTSLKFSLLYAVAATALCLVLLLTAGGTSSSSSSKISTSEESELIHSAYSSLHARMSLTRSLQAAPEEPVKFLLVSAEQPAACRTPHGSHLLLMSLKNKIDYCNMHQCKVWFSLESWELGFTGTWARYPLLKKLMLANSNIDWFMWMDSDALFTDLSFQIPLQQYSDWNKELIIPGYSDKIYGEDPDWLGLNAGIFLIRNTDWSRRFLDKWMSFRPTAPEDHRTALLNAEFKSRPMTWPADDQSALAYLLRQNRSEHERKTYLEAGYTLHGFWEVIVDKYEELLEAGNVRGRKWPFITHFCGCKLCTGAYATSQSQRCLTSFRRAYNFADNQVLALAGMIHPDLSSADVETV